MKYSFIAQHKKTWPIDMMCQLMGIKRGSYYTYQRRQKNRPKDPEHQEMIEWIKKVAESSQYTRLCSLVGKAGFLNQISANCPCHYLKCFTQNTGFACKKPAQGKRHAQHPLTNRLGWKYGIYQHCSTLNHPRSPATGAKTTALATECDQLFPMA